MYKIIEIVFSHAFLLLPLGFLYMLVMFKLTGSFRKFVGLFVVLENPLTREERTLHEMARHANDYKPDGYKMDYHTFKPSTSSCRGCGSNLRVNGRCGHCGC